MQVLNSTCDSMKVAVTCKFPIGANSTCPHLTGYTVKDEGGMLVADLYYNISGTWSTIGCDRTDTLNAVVAPEGYLRIRTNALLSGDTIVAVTYTTILYCATIGIKELNKNLFCAYPNPVQGSFVIKATGIDLSKFTASVYDLHGKRVIAASTNRENAIEIDGRNLPGGVYIVNLGDDNGGRATLKIIVVK
jgi:hypothetical protein